MHKVWELLFPLAIPFLTFAEGNGDGGDGNGNGDGESGDGNGNGNGDGDGNGNGDGEGDGNGDDADSIKAELAKARAALKKANAEAKERRLKLKKFEEEEAERAKAKLSELEKAQADLQEAAAQRDQLQQINIDLVIRHSIELEAMKLGFQDPADAFSLIDMGEIEVDDETAEVSGVEKALRALAKAKPYLLSGDDDTDSHGTPSAKGKKKGSKIKKGVLPERSMANL